MVQQQRLHASELSGSINIIRVLSMRYCIIILLFCITTSLLSQTANNNIHIALSARIDTTNTEVHDILTTWMNYLRSRPDSLYNNNNWVLSERQTMPEFDLTRNWIFQSQPMLFHYQPTVLSIENEGTLRCIRTMFSYADSNGVAPLAIHRIYAQQQSGQWFLRGAWSVLTQSWNRSTFGKITYVYSNKNTFSTALARKSALWCDSLANVFELNLGESTVFVCDTRDELARIIGLDFFITPPHGITYQENAMMFSGLGTPWHPHELAHLVFAQYSATHPLLKEGIATWVGGSLGDSYNSLVHRFVATYSNSTFNFYNVLQNPVEQSETFYTVGAIICNSVFDIGGAEAVRILLSSQPSDKDLYSTLAQLLRVKPEMLSSFIMLKAKYYAQKSNTNR